MTRVKCDVLDRNRERIFNRIATRGVVKFFNVCNQEQKDLDNKVKVVAGNSERKKDKILSSIDKGSFLDRLKEDDEIDTENSNKPSWSVLRDDFIMGNGIKEWTENQSDEEVDEQEKNIKIQKPKNKKKNLRNKKK
ncbi:RRP15 isoform X2 [Brachionus plicatilis]|uniref:RRP15-like protein n=1 Tax=Brachionus plicatilis TaxID=10195 RepID=A0A3M7RLJ9_BRAPC|nr:RRP15 isoform X2 [Brachionus plicatilis]